MTVINFSKLDANWKEQDSKKSWTSQHYLSKAFKRWIDNVQKTFTCGRFIIKVQYSHDIMVTNQWIRRLTPRILQNWGSCSACRTIKLLKMEGSEQYGFLLFFQENQLQVHRLRKNRKKKWFWNWLQNNSLIEMNEIINDR